MQDRKMTGLTRTAVMLAVLLVLPACRNPVSSGDHTFAYGVVVREGTETLVHAQGDAVTGALALSAGQQRGPLTVRMLDRHGNDIEPRPGYWLRVTSQAPAVATWQQPTAGEFGGTLTGVGPGQTSLEFCNMHGAVGGGHPDGCQTVAVTVAAQP
jgi:hypothetical protein